MTNKSLSHAAKAVLDAYEVTADAAADSDDLNALAAALRAAANQLDYWLDGSDYYVISLLLDIADELKVLP